jgi:hypothetical protein
MTPSCLQLPATALANQPNINSARGSPRSSTHQLVRQTLAGYGECPRALLERGFFRTLSHPCFRSPARRACCAPLTRAKALVRARDLPKTLIGIPPPRAHSQGALASPPSPHCQGISLAHGQCSPLKGTLRSQGFF